MMPSRFFQGGAAGAFALALALAPSTSVLAANPAAEAAARDYVQKNRQKFGLSPSDTAGLAVSSSAFSAHNRVTHVYLQQTHRGIPVHNAIFNVNVKADGSVLSAGDRLFRGLAAAAGQQAAVKGPVEAGRAAVGHVNLRPTREIRLASRIGGAREAAVLTDGGIASKPLAASLVWLPQGNALRLAWSVEIEERSGRHWWMAFVDAETGASLGQHDLVVSDDIKATSSAVSRPTGGPVPSFPFPPTDGATYNVFAWPLESPDDGPRTVASNTADPASSPFGWHDTDGAAGAEFTVTRGNNVHAYTDLDANNVPDPGSDPDGGAGLVFDFPLDLTMGPDTYRPFAAANLFYWNNIMHDIAHNYGFDEVSGNFQVNNYGNGGLANDDVRAEAQDGSGTNNANFGTGVDGTRPRMQMFVWTHPRPNTVTVASGPAAGDYEASGAAFGPTFLAHGPVTATVELVNDGVIGTGVPPAPDGTLNDGCEPFTVTAGNIALLERGFCAFVVKVENAQAAGASAVIVQNNAAGVITMGGASVVVTIPSLMMDQTEGGLVRANLPLTATLAADPTRGINRDSDLDAGVILHEYGHGVSNRLTGGPATAACLGNAEQMGEGWSDWFGMALTGHPDDRPTHPRGVGRYVIFGGPGSGIRPTPYSTDTSINPSTYASVANTVAISQPHGIGYVWNTMLWEMYWNLIDRHGYNPNLYADWQTGGNNRALQFVMDGMKNQPCTPGFVDGRNGILAGDLALGGVNQCEIWRAFAKRGLGFSASQGLSTSRTDGVAAFDLPASCTAATFVRWGRRALESGVRAGSTITIGFTVTNGGSPDVDSQQVDCTTGVPVGEVPVLMSPVTQSGDNYSVSWPTSAAWAGTCRRVTVRLAAPADAHAFFTIQP